MIVVVGIDDTEQSRRALRRAKRLTDWLQGHLHVVYVSHLPPVVLAAIEHAPLQLEEIEAQERSAVWGSAREIIEGEGNGSTITEVNLTGYPPDALVEYAGKVAADLIVVGSRGRGDLAALVLGSTSHRVLNTAPCDVLVVKGDGS